MLATPGSWFLVSVDLVVVCNKMGREVNGALKTFVVNYGVYP